MPSTEHNRVEKLRKQATVIADDVHAHHQGDAAMIDMVRQATALYQTGQVDCSYLELLTAISVQLEWR